MGVLVRLPQHVVDPGVVGEDAGVDGAGQGRLTDERPVLGDERAVRLARQGGADALLVEGLEVAGEVQHVVRPEPVDVGSPGVRLGRPPGQMDHGVLGGAPGLEVGGRGHRDVEERDDGRAARVQVVAALGVEEEGIRAVLARGDQLSRCGRVRGGWRLGGGGRRVGQRGTVGSRGGSRRVGGLGGCGLGPVPRLSGQDQHRHGRQGARAQGDLPPPGGAPFRGSDRTGCLGADLGRRGWPVRVRSGLGLASLIPWRSSARRSEGVARSPRGPRGRRASASDRPSGRSPSREPGAVGSPPSTGRRRSRSPAPDGPGRRNFPRQRARPATPDLRAPPPERAAHRRCQPPPCPHPIASSRNASAFSIRWGIAVDISAEAGDRSGNVADKVGISPRAIDPGRGVVHHDSCWEAEAPEETGSDRTRGSKGLIRGSNQEEAGTVGDRRGGPGTGRGALERSGPVPGAGSSDTARRR